MWAPGSQWGQWPLDASSYQNVNHEHVDWAALAQQWIQMKEVHETVVINLPATAGLEKYASRALPPPPPAMGFFASDSSTVGGEAPMDVERDEEIEENAELSQGSQESLPWKWDMHVQQPKWTQPPVSSDNLMPQAFHNVTPPTTQPVLSSLPIVGRTIGSSDEDSGSAPSSFASMPALDAAKRKQLPAWIREGLEKMEREKQKREERQQFLQHRELRRKQELLMSSVDDETILTRSRFDDDDDDEQDGREEDISARAASPPAKLQVEDLVAVIRRLMTEILLEVTTEEIKTAATEAYTQRLRVKSRAAPQPSLDPSSKRVKPLTQQLGLDQYGSDDDEDEAASSSRQLHIDLDSSIEERSQKERASNANEEVDQNTCVDKTCNTKITEEDKEDRECQQLYKMSKPLNKKDTKVETDTSESGSNRNRHGVENSITPSSVGHVDTKHSPAVSDKRPTKSLQLKKRSRSRSRERRSRSRERTRRSRSRRRSKSRSRDRRRSRSRDRYHRRRSHRSRSSTSRRSGSRVRSRSRSRSRGRSSRAYRSHPHHSAK